MTKIALLSDIHFGEFSTTKDFSVPGEHLISEEEGAKSLKVELIKKLVDEKIEYVIVAGDLTSIGSPSEFFYCRKEILEIITKSNIDKSKVIMCLGNHDIDWKITGISNGYSNVSEELINTVKTGYLQVAGAVANHWLFNEFEFENLKKGPAPYSGIKEYENVIFFTLNSGWLCSENESIKQGKLNTDQLNWLSKSLKKYESSNKWKILVLHHHPFNYAYAFPIADHSLLLEGPELMDVIGKYGVNIVCHGHRHHPRVKNELESSWKNAITFISAGSLSVNIQHRKENIPNLFHVIELQKDKSFYLRSYQYSTLDGWEKHKSYNLYTPIDFEMYFKKPFTDSYIKRNISNLCSLNNKDDKVLPKWKTLPPALKSITLNELNLKIKEYCDGNGLKLFGKYPDENVAIIKT